MIKDLIVGRDILDEVLTKTKDYGVFLAENADISYPVGPNQTRRIILDSKKQKVSNRLVNEILSGMALFCESEYICQVQREMLSILPINKLTSILTDFLHTRKNSDYPRKSESYLAYSAMHQVNFALDLDEYVAKAMKYDSLYWDQPLTQRSSFKYVPGDMGDVTTTPRKFATLEKAKGKTRKGLVKMLYERGLIW